MDDDSRPQTEAQTRLRNGQLPQRRADRIWGGPGDSVPCSVCSTSIRPDQMGIDAEFDTDNGVQAYSFHVRCFAIWELERDHFVGAGTYVSQSPRSLSPAPADATMPGREHSHPRRPRQQE